MESGSSFAAKMFIDASYEGDLMAKAGVSYTVGREANAEYGETINGIQTKGAKSYQFIKSVDPYVKPGDPKSGIIFGVPATSPGTDFKGDRRIQAYNYRRCTTDVPENRLDWKKPANYDEKMFELALRNIEAGDHRIQWIPVWMPNRKTDTNNNFAVSSDFIGMEPVFMVLGQSAATAAAQAIDQNISVQDIDYAKLKTRLLEDRQILDLPPSK